MRTRKLAVIESRRAHKLSGLPARANVRAEYAALLPLIIPREPGHLDDLWVEVNFAPVSGLDEQGDPKAQTTVASRAAAAAARIYFDATRRLLEPARRAARF